MNESIVLPPEVRRDLERAGNILSAGMANIRRLTAGIALPSAGLPEDSGPSPIDRLNERMAAVLDNR